MPLANYTHFCCRSGGSNLNAGTRTGDTTEPGTSADLTYASGNWVQSTGVFTVASGDPSADGVAVGDWASVYADGSSATGFIGRVTARDSTTITVSTTVKGGTAPTNGTGDRTLKIGGAWLGPNGATAWLDTFPAAAMVNASSHTARVNLKNDQTYSITAQIALSTGDVTVVAGYENTYGDLGRATIDGGTSGASYNIFNVGASASTTRLEDLVLQNNGATGSANGVANASNCLTLVRCVLSNFRGSGVSNTLRIVCIECEAFGCNQSNSANLGGFTTTSAPATYIRCNAHDNAGSNTLGFRSSVGATIVDCVAASNGSIGIELTGTTHPNIVANCDAYANTGDGIFVNAGPGSYVENCNLFANGGWGIGTSNATVTANQIRNCSFGAGTMVNTSGTIEGGDSFDSITYPANTHPWVDPDNGDFRINSALAANSGRGYFLQTDTSWFGTLGFPARGAAQPAVVANDGGTIFAPEGSVGTASNKTSQDTITITGTITVLAGQLLIVGVATDNEDTADGETSLHTSCVIDGHSATKMAEYTNAEGGAGNGVTVSAWYLIAPANIDAGSATITTLNQAKDAKVSTAFLLDWNSSFTLSVDTYTTLAADAGQPGSLAATPSADVPHLLLRFSGGETSLNTLGTPTATQGWSLMPAAGTNGGAAASNVVVFGEYKVISGTDEQTSNPTAVSADWASILVVLSATLPGGSGGGLGTMRIGL